MLEAMDQNHVATTQIVASLTPFQFFIEARSKAELAKRRIFGVPAFFLLVNLTYQWILLSFGSIRKVSGLRFHLFASRAPTDDDSAVAAVGYDAIVSAVFARALQGRKRRRGVASAGNRFRCRNLGERVGSLAAEGDAIIAALDELIGRAFGDFFTYWRKPRQKI
jgi:hypothetical protein